MTTDPQPTTPPVPTEADQRCSARVRNYRHKESADRDISAHVTQARAAAVREHSQHVKDFMEELSEYLGIDGPEAKPADFIKAASDIREKCGEDRKRIAELEAFFRFDKNISENAADLWIRLASWEGEDSDAQLQIENEIFSVTARLRTQLAEREEIIRQMEYQLDSVRKLHTSALDTVRERDTTIATMRQQFAQVAEKYDAESLAQEKEIERLRALLERTTTAINAGFGKAQRDHIVAEARAELKGRTP